MPNLRDALRKIDTDEALNGVVAITRDLYSRASEFARQRGGNSNPQFSPNLTPSGDLPALKINAQLSSSGNTLTMTPIDSGLIMLLGDNGWDNFALLTAATLSTAGYTSGRLYDVYIYPDQNLDPPAPALETSIWTNETTRSEAIDTANGAVVKLSDNTRRLFAVCRYNGSTLLVPKYDPNGEIIFGTGDPRNNVADPFSGVGMSAGGVTFGAYIWQFFAAVAGVVGVGFNSAGQLLFGAGKGLLSVLGMILTADVYPSSAYIKWLAADTAASIGEVIATYAGAVVNSGVLIYGWAHDVAVRGFVQLGAKDYLGVVKATLTIDTNGNVTVDNTAAAAGAVLVKTKTSIMNAMSEILQLYVAKNGVPLSGFGTAIGFYAQDSAANDQQIGYIGIRYTDPTDASEDTEIVLARRVAGVDTGTAIAEFIYTLLDDASAAAVRKTLDATSADGWIEVSDSWTYASANTINIPTDGTTRYQKGDFIRWKQGGGYKYGAASIVSATLLTIIVNTDYTVANSAITDIAFSRMVRPLGWPVFFNWAANPTGYSAQPTNTVYRYKVEGNQIQWSIRELTPGTSNGTGMTFTPPVTAATITNASWQGSCFGRNNSVDLAAPSYYLINSAGTTIICYPTYALGLWTNANTKCIYSAQGWYEF